MAFNMLLLNWKGEKRSYAMTKIIESFRTRLEKALSESGLKPIELAERTGISQSTISQYRSGYSKPKDKRLVKIAEVLNVDPAWLMGLDVPMIKRDDVKKSRQLDGYYINDETARMAQTIFENKELRALFDAAQDAKPDDLKTAYDVLLALKRKENE